ncbi:MAG: hypothetical protein V3W44_08180, partial [Dehalococcoidales bacterium]
TDLRGDHRFDTILEFVVGERDAALQDCADVTDHARILRSQGRVQFANELLKCKTSAPTILEKFKNAK